MTEHTPTPWEAGPNPAGKSGGTIISAATGLAWPSRVAVAALPAHNPQTKANAAYIVRVVNAHQSLVEALEWALGATERPEETPEHDCGYERGEGTACRFHEKYWAARVVLDLARGEQP